MDGLIGSSVILLTLHGKDIYFVLVICNLYSYIYENIQAHFNVDAGKCKQKLNCFGAFSTVDIVAYNGQGSKIWSENW